MKAEGTGEVRGQRSEDRGRRSGKGVWETWCSSVRRGVDLKTVYPEADGRVFGIQILNLGFVSDFELRISDFDPLALWVISDL